MTNREARKRLRRRGLSFMGYSPTMGAWGSECACATDETPKGSHRINIRVSAPVRHGDAPWLVRRRDANRRLVEFVETHFGEVK